MIKAHLGSIDENIKLLTISELMLKKSRPWWYSLIFRHEWVLVLLRPESELIYSKKAECSC
jgi:hypothetical protein